MSVTATFPALLAMMRRDAQIFWSYRTRFISQTLNSFVSVTLFYYISRLLQIDAFTDRDGYFAFVVIGLVILNVLHSTVTITSLLQTELWTGNFERLVLSPAGPRVALVGMVLWPLLWAGVQGLQTLVFAALVFGMDLSWATAPLALPVALVGAAVFASLGLFFCAVTLLFKQAAAGLSWVMTGITIIGGFYFPIALLPDWIEWSAHVQPFTPAIELLRHLLVDTPLRESATASVIKLVGFAAVLLPLSLLAIGAATRAAQRRGTIIEY